MTDTSYKYWPAMSDKALALHLGNFIKHHRMEQHKTQEALALAAGISRSTLSLLERGETVTMATFIQVLRVLDLLHVMEAFNVAKVISPMALVKEAKAQRYRVRVKK
jgi:transcriptional regulator with XRE-family HTH domain